ncbi:hypothetical protein A2U01_0100693, partial [Trifolium medium]|nr:hypothetical protein [Trifolium medium]
EVDNGSAVVSGRVLAGDGADFAVAVVVIWRVVIWRAVILCGGWPVSAA